MNNIFFGVNKIEAKPSKFRTKLLNIDSCFEQLLPGLERCFYQIIPLAQGVEFTNDSKSLIMCFKYVNQNLITRLVNLSCNTELNITVYTDFGNPVTFLECQLERERAIYIGEKVYLFYYKFKQHG